MTPARKSVRARAATLVELSPGTRAVVRRVSGEPGLRRRLMELGFVPGTPIILIRRAPMGDPIELELRGTHFSLRSTEAERIDVDLY